LQVFPCIKGIDYPLPDQCDDREELEAVVS